VLAGVAVVGWFLHPAILALGTVGMLFTLYFFRDPERKVLAEPGQILAPADGKVVSIDEVEEKDFLGARCRRISIFLSVFDVHINRAPVSGTIEMLRYTPGRFGFANTADASRNNESNAIGIGGGPLRVMVKQIAGAVARRIICYCRKDQSVITGERIGLIRFGSRTELYLPLECRVLVSVGQKVKGGISLVGAYDASTEEEAQTR